MLGPGPSSNREVNSKPGGAVEAVDEDIWTFLSSGSRFNRSEVDDPILVKNRKIRRRHQEDHTLDLCTKNNQDQQQGRALRMQGSSTRSSKAHSEQIMILIPAWNEGNRIAPVIEGALQHLPVMVVDDGSTDQTANIARSMGTRVIEHGENRGKGVALQTGFEHALRMGCTAVLTMDADGQHAPEDIPLFLSAFQTSKADLIIGNRDWREAPFPRSWTNPFGSWLISQILKVPIYDSQSGFRLHSRRLLETVHLTNPGFALETEIIIQAVRWGLKIGWVPIRTLYDVGEISYFHPIHDSLDFFRMLRYAIRLMRNSIE
jgi:glycosyltransferase involved in cell wall biosynthesis